MPDGEESSASVWDLSQASTLRDLGRFLFVAIILVLNVNDCWDSNAESSRLDQESNPVLHLYPLALF